MRSATMVDGRCCYGDDDHTRRRSRSVGRAGWSRMLVQSAEQRHQSRWHMKKEARTDEGGGDRGSEGPEQRGIKTAAAPGGRPPPSGGCWSDDGRWGRRP